MNNLSLRLAVCAVISLTAVPCNLGRAATDSVNVEGRNIRLEFDRRMYSHVIARFTGKEIELGPFTPSETVTVDGVEMRDFSLAAITHRSVGDELGPGTQTTLTGRAGAVEKTVVVTVYDRFPQMAFFNVRYTNRGAAEMRVTAWSNNRYSISAPPAAAEPAFWSYESGSYERRRTGSCR